MRDGTVSRRDFLRTGLAGGAGAVLVLPALCGANGAADAAEGVCVTLCNHWSYTGIGWQLGIESSVLSATDAMEMADRAPHVKTCINLDARAYERMAEQFPEVAARLKQYLAAGKVELIGGTYGQPMGTTFSGESNIRQLVVGREAIRKALGYEMVTFLEEEEFTHPQVPQIVLGAGFRYASLAQMDTWGRAGCPPIEQNAILWKGIDGTTVPTIPKNSLFCCALEPKQLAASPEYKKLRVLGKPLIFKWEEFGWESPEHPDYLIKPAKYRAFAAKMPVEFVTCKEYLDKYGAHPQETVYLPMDAWRKSLTWGLGGDQLRILDRKVEAVLLAAERFDAIASALGAPTQSAHLELAWKDLLASQSHDVGLCEYSRWQDDRLAPLDRLEDHHNFTWGALGYNLLDAAEKQGRTALDASLAHLAARIDSEQANRSARAVTVFNPGGWQRSGLVATGRIYPIAEKAPGVIVKDSAGRTLPTQILRAERDPQGNLTLADVAFLAEKVPAVGYDTYYLDFGPEAPITESVPPRVRVDERALTLENEHIKVALDPATGGVRSLMAKPSGRETLDGAQAAFPLFTGRPNAHLSLRPNPPAAYDSSKSRAQIDWLERGPLRATVRARHLWPRMTFETRVSLTAGSPYVEVLTRLLARVPPQSDAAAADIKEGYWFSLAPAFEPASVVRDFPLAVEPTQKDEFHALTFVDLVGKDVGLLLLHAGTEWFRRGPRGRLSNLVMREWESLFTHEYGWPIYAEYRHALLPHAGNLTNADRLRASAAMSQPLLVRFGSPQAGDLPAAKGFVTVAPDAVQLSALRRKPGAGLEVRVVEVEGRTGEAGVELALPVAAASETDLLGNRVADVARQGDRLDFTIQPWKIRTFEITV